MALQQTTMNQSSGRPTQGWHKVTINKGEYGTWTDGKKYIDLFFNELGENYKCRISEVRRKDTNEEWKIAQVFHYTNSGIVDVLEGPNQKDKVVQWDDDVKHLVGKELNVFLYEKPNGYLGVSKNVAPVETHKESHDKLKYNAEYVTKLKTSAESQCKQWEMKSGSGNGSANQFEEDIQVATTDQIKEMVSNGQAANASADDLPF